ncbi:hypothetical protein [Acinetobacter lwoffii]|uniref:hypothetical protein n=1 Tax=Acinetobacter lwoffii TaxID=28090 RepID=UPI002DB7C725|nr:hypothetical protein [Acinetobacter lwoffii]MEB6679321.1 hypothetical protein [Acinetobacter lwoffii]
MGSKKKFFEPITGTNIDRAIGLCIGIPKDLKKFQDDIHYLDSNQLFQEQFVHQLLLITGDIEELHHLLIGMVDPKDIYYSSLRTALAGINNAANSLIITAYYLNPAHRYKRLLNQHSFTFEITLILKKVNFVKEILERVNKGDPVNRGIPRPISSFRSRT